MTFTHALSQVLAFIDGETTIGFGTAFCNFFVLRRIFRRAASVHNTLSPRTFGMRMFHPPRHK